MSGLLVHVKLERVPNCLDKTFASLAGGSQFMTGDGPKALSVPTR